MTDRAASSVRRRDLMVAGSAGAFAAFMVGMAYAAVPLYDWFCRTTGFGGTTQVATAAPGEVLDRKITVRFDANVGAGLPWRFEPERTSIEAQARRGRHRQLSRDQSGGARDPRQAAYNVTPLSMGIYFQKINCFCFTEQRSRPARSATWPWCSTSIRRWRKDADGKDVNTITLSYTFYPLREPQRPVADEHAGRPAGTDLGATETGNGRRARQAATRLPPRRSEPVADRRLGLGVRAGGRR